MTIPICADLEGISRIYLPGTFAELQPVMAYRYLASSIRSIYPTFDPIVLWLQCRTKSLNHSLLAATELHNT